MKGSRQEFELVYTVKSDEKKVVLLVEAKGGRLRGRIGRRSR